MSTSNSLHGITLLRGLAATLILVIHSLLLLGYSHTYSEKFTLTNIGVDIFFVLSGFIMAFAHWNDFGKGAEGASLFLKKRFLRIYPMYFILTAFTAAIIFSAPALFHSLEYSNTLLLQSLLFLPSKVGVSTSLILAVAWTLAFEVIFYFLFSLCLLFRRPTGLKLIVLLLLLWAVAGALFTSEHYIINFFLSTLPLEFTAGVFICIYFKSKHYRPLYNSQVGAMFLIITALTFTLAIPFPVADRLLTDNYRVIYYGLPAAAIFICFLSFSPKLYFSKIITAVGDASYSTYLTHFLFLGALKFAANRFGLIEGINIYVLIVFSCLFCTLGGIATHRIIEAPITHFLKRVLLGKKHKQPIFEPPRV